MVCPERLDELVPAISRYANTQNRIAEADFASNEPFHVTLQRLSRSVKIPGEERYWFYERTRGQYQVEKSRKAKNAAARKQFEAITPKDLVFSKTDLAKYQNAWDMLPHVVSLGAQKNFIEFMRRLYKAHGAAWKPNEEYYRTLIAKAILFNEIERLAGESGISAYRANVVAYTMACVRLHLEQQIDLEEIWQQQQIPEFLRTRLSDWIPLVAETIKKSAGRRNVTEWCKKEGCWKAVSNLTFPV